MTKFDERTRIHINAIHDSSATTENFRRNFQQTLPNIPKIPRIYPITRRDDNLNKNYISNKNTNESEIEIETEIENWKVTNA